MTISKLSASDQETITDEVLAANLKTQQEKGPDLRHVHPKSHGLVWGEFIVENNIPDALKVGVFCTPKTYPIWVRFSNGGEAEKRGQFKPDKEPDVRGLAIKLMNVEGEKILDDEEKTQDFLSINHPVFFVRDVQGYVDLAKVASGQADPELAQAMQPSFAILQKMTSKKINNPLFIQYWSTTPYKLGSQAIKFSVKSQQIEAVPDSIPDSENYLREAIVKYLTDGGKEAIFDFLIQLYVDEEKTSIENPMQKWKEEDSPFIKVATIRIPSQKFDFDERKRLDEGLSFNPWHTLPEHEPIGSVNLARKKIYQELAKYRREQIEKRLREPQPFSFVQDEPR
ncbi:catalase family protein [Scytonema tolypothrichoides VB-61278]|nr:catalase family protein [Scytonema tolypothrichoides VB-61278]